MNSSLTNKDYRQLLLFYGKPIPKNKKRLSEDAEKILAEKLCRCIKKIDIPQEPRAIGICTKTIFNAKGLTRGKFKCKNPKMVTFRKKIMTNKTKKRQTKNKTKKLK
jgi:hypothetical protein